MRMAIRTVLAVMLMLLIMSHAVAAQPTNENWYKRVYTGLEKQQVNALVQELFEAEGYEVFPVKPNDKAVASEWLEVKPDDLKKGWKERWRFRSFIHFHVQEEKKTIIVIDLIKEHLPPGGERWQNKRVDFYNDQYYRGILDKLDKLVRDAGGQVSDMEQ